MTFFLLHTNPNKIVFQYNTQGYADYQMYPQVGQIGVDTLQAAIRMILNVCYKIVQRILHPDTAVQSLPTMAVHVMDSKFAVGPVYDARGDAYVNALTSEPTAEIQAIWGDKS